MNKKVKAFLSVLFMSLTFYMILENRYINPLGDYVVEFIGLKSWSGDHIGAHLTIFYFISLFIIGNILVERYVIRDLKIKRIEVIIIFIGLNIIFSLSTGEIIKNIKANSEGLLTIGCERNNNNDMTYSFKDGIYTKFIAEIKLTNYSKEDKKFHLMIDNNYYDYSNIAPIRLYDLDGNRSVFKLRGKETKIFSINLDNYLVKSDYIKEIGNGSCSGYITGITVFDDMGNEVKIGNKDFFGTNLNKQ